jgi:predicted RNase H-like HicB family nuclease
MHNSYEITICWSEDDKVFLAEVPELPGCAAHGVSLEEARAQSLQAIELWIETAREFGRLIPQS